MQQRKLKVQQIEEDLNYRRHVEEQNRVQRDLNLLMTKSFEDMFAEDALPQPAPPLPQPAPVRPTMINGHSQINAAQRSNVSTRPSKSSQPGATSRSTSKPRTIPSTSQDIPSPGVPIVRRSRRAAADCDSSDDEFGNIAIKQPTTDNAGDDEDNYENDEFDGADNNAKREGVNAALQRQGNNSDDDEASSTIGRRNLLEVKAEEEKKKRLQEGKLFALQQRKKRREESEQKKQLELKLKEDRVQKLAKVNEESRKRVHVNAPEQAKSKLTAGRKERSQSDNIPIYGELT